VNNNNHLNGCAQRNALIPVKKAERDSVSRNNNRNGIVRRRIIGIAPQDSVAGKECAQKKSMKLNGFSAVRAAYRVVPAVVPVLRRDDLLEKSYKRVSSRLG